jgi:transcriptional regulator with XRE-family HTH domain
MTILIDSISDNIVEPADDGKAATIAQNTSNTCVGRRLRTRRITSGISEGEFCRKLGIDRGDLIAYERGLKRVRANLLLLIARLLGVKPDYFFQAYTAKELSACLESSF